MPIGRDEFYTINVIGSCIWNFLVTRFMKEMSYVFLFTIFFTAAHFHLGGG